MTLKHTPGPWHVGMTITGRPAIVYAESGYAVCNCVTHHGRSSEDDMTANARLISAAPDLLAALEIVSNCVPDSDGGTTLGTWEMEQVRAAIRKATGE